MPEHRKTTSAPPGAFEIDEAAGRIRSFIHKTPVMTSSAIDQIAGCACFFKCENLQKTGAFKIRGATNAVFSLSEKEASRGVATHSSGNHAAALALSAKWRGVNAYVVMPRTASEIKRAAVNAYGAEIIACEPTLQARESTLADVIRQTGAAFVHPYNDSKVIAGQATAARELLGQVSKLDILIAPVGGGGLLSGTCLSAARMAPEVSIYAAEPQGADDAFRSLQAGRLIPSENPKTIADGLLTSLGSLTYPVIRDHVKEIITVNDQEITDSMRMIWERMKIIVEPSSATVLAACLKRSELFSNKRIGLIISGGNVDLNNLPWG